jgi:hypothetical protein
MWGYQPHFRISQETAATHLFRKLDNRLAPEIFVVGVLADGAVNTFPACVEPEDEYWIHSEDFNEVPAISERLRGTYPEARMFQSHPLAQKWQDEDLLKSKRQTIPSVPAMCLVMK